MCFSTVIQGEVGHIVMTPSDKQLVVVDKRKLLLPPLYNKMFTWGYIDHNFNEEKIALASDKKPSNNSFFYTWVYDGNGTIATSIQDLKDVPLAMMMTEETRSPVTCNNVMTHAVYF